MFQKVRYYLGGLFFGLLVLGMVYGVGSAIYLAITQWDQRQDIREFVIYTGGLFAIGFVLWCMWEFSHGQDQK